MMKSAIREFAIIAVIAIVIFVGIRTTLQSSVVFGRSMEPTFWDNQRVLVSRVVYKMHTPERGDVIVFEPPRRPDEDNYIKRVIGLPGEKVELKDDAVFIHQPDGNVIKLTEPYIKEPAERNYISGIIGEGEYFVLGDNRNNTNDSRNGWMVEEEAIVGKAWITTWPPSLWGMAANYPPTDDVAVAAPE